MSGNLICESYFPLCSSLHIYQIYTYIFSSRQTSVLLIEAILNTVVFWSHLVLASKSQFLHFQKLFRLLILHWSLEIGHGENIYTRDWQIVQIVLSFSESQMLKIYQYTIPNFSWENLFNHWISTIRGIFYFILIKCTFLLVYIKYGIWNILMLYSLKQQKLLTILQSCLKIELLKKSKTK